MKKIIITLFLTLVFVTSSLDLSYANNHCKYNEVNSISVNLTNCLDQSALIKSNDLEIKNGGGFAKKMQQWTNTISLYLGILAISSIVFGALMMTLSTGEDEKIKKAKDIVKWGIVGFVGIISVSAIINLVVKIMYSI